MALSVSQLPSSSHRSRCVASGVSSWWHEKHTLCGSTVEVAVAVPR